MTPNAQDIKAENPQEIIAERLQSFGSRLSKLAGEQAASRSQLEQRWLRDIRQFHGEYTEEEKARMKESDSSEVFVNKTRNKAYAAESRVTDMLFPTDDKNWGIRPTPVPEVSLQGIKDQGLDPEKVRQQIEQQAKEKADLMQMEIDDQLTESDYNSTSRKIIHDAVQVGTGIIKGPVIVGRQRQRWESYENGVSELVVEETLEPSIARVDFWNFYPDMSATAIDECEFIFERHLWTKRQLREFAKLPDVVTSSLKHLVSEDNDAEHIAESRINDIRAITGVDTVNSSNRYEVWEYHGPIKKSELMDALDAAETEYFEEDMDELNDEVEAVVFFSANRILKVVLNPLETEERPYSVFNWAKDESSIFGFGIPYLMRTAQRVINAAYRMMMDNAGASVSDIIVANKQLIEPGDKEWTSTPGKKKLYFLKDKTRSVQEAFASFTIPNHQVELERIYMLASQLADEETNMPLIAQGEQAAHVTRTSSGMAMLMNSANIVLRGAIKNWDDDITRQVISRFYNWNMQFTNKPEIKGDFTIDARGSSVLLVRDKQQENLMVYANLSAQNPELMMRRDWEGLDQELAKSLEIPYDKLTLSDEEVEKKRQMMAQSQQQDQGGDEVKVMELKLKQQQQQFDQQLEQQRLQFDIQLKQAELAQNKELKMAEIASRENLTIEQVRTKYDIEQTREQNKRDIAAGKLTNDQTKIQLQAENLSKGFDTY